MTADWIWVCASLSFLTGLIIGYLIGHILGHTEGWDEGRQYGWRECGTVPEAHRY